MATEVILPHLGESILEATLVSWLFEPADKVRRGDVLAEVETDKAVLDLESPANGILLAVVVEEGETVTTSQLLAVIGKADEVWEPKEKEPESAPPVAQPALDSAKPPSETAKKAEPASRRRVSPAARKLAQKLGVDIDGVQPQKPGARVMTVDVEHYAAQIKTGEASSIPSHRVALSGVRKIVAKRMTQSAQTIPQFSVTVEADISSMLSIRKTLNEQPERAGTGISLTALLVYLAAKAIKYHPLVNACFDGDSVIVYDALNIAVAVAAPDGLVAPVIHSVETLGIDEIAVRLVKMTAAARERKLAPTDIAGATFTISNLGMFGVTQFVPLVNPPQAAILGVGTGRPMLVPDGGGGASLVQLLRLTVSADHRVLDGEAVARFLATLKEEIEHCTI